MTKYTLITGASSGIGKATAKYFAMQGKNLMIVSRNKQRLEELKKEIEQESHVTVQVMAYDLSEQEQVFELYNQTKNYDIDIWVNNAGLGHSQSILNQDINKVLSMNHLNVDAVTILTTLYAQDYQDRDATLINVSSINGYSITQGNPAYSATKFYVNALSEALYWELKTKNKPMRIKIVAPAATSTEFLGISKNVDQAEIDFDKEFGKYSTSEEIAEFIYKLYESDQLTGFADGHDYSLHLTGPNFPHSLNKADIPSLLVR